MQRRPFVKEWLYDSRLFIDRRGQADKSFGYGEKLESAYIAFHCISSTNELCCFAGNLIPDLNLLKKGNGGTFYLSRYRYTPENERVEGITDWALKQFTANYKTTGKSKKISKESIFHYCYAVLHDPIYREKYALNLKREFPRIPFYTDFWQWAAWGEQLMALHIGYEGVAPFKLERTDIEDTKARTAGLQPKAMLKSDAEAGSITLDTETTLRGIPKAAWTYKLGNRCAIDWVLDQYKEKKPKDPTIREKFDTYRFADYKEKVIDLLARVTTVSVETAQITAAMQGLAR